VLTLLKNKLPKSITDRITSAPPYTPYALILALTTLMFLPFFSLQLGITDDHEIVWLLDALYVDGFSGFWSRWLSLEDFGTAPRFRPVYYLLRAIEILLWRDNALLWALTRCGIAAFFALGIYELAKRHVSPSMAMLLSVATLSVPWFSDIFFRLGPSETYATIFTIILTLSLLTKKSEISWLTVSMSIFVLIGIKENFIILFPLQLFSLYKLARARTFTSSAISAIFSAASLLCISILFYKLKLSAGHDIYNQAAGLSRAGTALNSILFTFSGWISFATAAVFSYALLSKKKSTHKSNRFTILIYVIFVLVFNVYVYSGIPDILSRYAFPYWPFLTGMLIYAYMVIVKGSNVFDFIPNKRAIFMSLAAAACVCQIINAYAGHLYAKRTSDTHTAITQLLEATENTEKIDLIITHTTTYMDIEPAVSIARYLNFWHISKPLYLFSEITDVSDVENNHSATIYETLSTIQHNGGEGYTSFTLMPSKYNCIEINFHESPTKLCRQQINIPF